METRTVLKDRAIESLKGKWLMGVALLLIYFIVVGGLSGLNNEIANLVGIVLALFLVYGVDCFFLSTARQENAGLGTLLEGFKDNRVFGTTALRFLYTLLWTLLLIIPGIIKQYSYALTCYVLKDNPDLKYNSAIEESMRLMQGHKLKLFLLDLSFIGWYLLGFLALGIGALWVMTYHYTARAHFYEVLKAAE